jgi:hypothetical protein
VDEEEYGGLRALADVLLGYGERHFDGPPGQKGSRRGVWAGVLLMCGQFERVSASMSVKVYALNLPSGCGSTLGQPRNGGGGGTPRHCTCVPWFIARLLSRGDI